MLQRRQPVYILRIIKARVLYAAHTHVHTYKVALIDGTPVEAALAENIH